MKNEKAKMFIIGFLIGMVFTLIIVRIFDQLSSETIFQEEYLNDQELLNEFDQLDNSKSSTDSADTEYLDSN